MATLSMFKLGAKVSMADLKHLINSQSFQVHGRQIIGDIVQWVGGDSVEDTNHLGYAPENTMIYAREHYYGSVGFTKRGQDWFVTSIRTH